MALRSSVREHISQLVRAAYLPEEEIADLVLEVALEEDDAPEEERVSEREVRAGVRAEIQVLLDQQRTWVEPTDCDKLTQAFARLGTQGIVCRENFTCCMTCGFAEIHDEAEAEKQAGKAVQGVAFFHQQDTESAVGGGGVMLAYDSLSSMLTQRDVGQIVVNELRRCGLNPEWNGSESQRIHVPLDWRRRWTQA